jgi:hypothetical protein
MRNKFVFGTVIFSLCLLFITGCQINNDETDSTILSTTQIEEIVKNKFEKNSDHGEITIVEIKFLSNGQYQVKWKRSKNCENGTEYFDQKTGENVGTSEYSVC